jgi:hypothetical protein
MVRVIDLVLSVHIADDNHEVQIYVQALLPKGYSYRKRALVLVMNIPQVKKQREPFGISYSLDCVLHFLRVTHRSQTRSTKG